MRNAVFKEPEGGRQAWIFLLIGCYFLIETIFFREGCFERLVYLVFGTAVLGFGAADLLPRGQTGLAGLLRVGGVALMVLALLVRILQLAV